jgi:hypothetical protein
MVGSLRSLPAPAAARACDPRPRGEPGIANDIGGQNRCKSPGFRHVALSRGQIITGSLRVSGSWSAQIEGRTKLHGRKPLQVPGQILTFAPSRFSPNVAVEPMVAATAKQTFGRRAESTAVWGFLPFEEIAVDDGFAQIAVVRRGLANESNRPFADGRR